MKKIFIFAVTALMAVGCSKPSEYGHSGQRACDYVEDVIVKSGFEVKKVEIIEVDTLLSPAFLEDMDLEFRTNNAKYMSGGISAEEYKAYLMDYMKDTYKIMPFMLSKSANDSLKNQEKYKPYFRRVYKIEATTSSKMNPKQTFYIMTDINGEPEYTEDEALHEAEQHRNEAESIYMTIF